ncbi:MAG: LamG domain-containing protein [Ferruginibacter sp.]|nr:LamG domain-containing protein [Ferruginibacter sp.]
MNKNAKKLIIGAAAFLLLGGAMISCKKDKAPVVIPPDPIGGFNNSDEVGGTNLKAHWTFDGTTNEKISSLAPLSGSANTFAAAGLKGQALSLDSGYLLYPTIPALNVANLGSVTVSAWIKTQNNGRGATAVFGLTTGTATQADWNNGPVLMYLENGFGVSYNDTLVLKGVFATYPVGVPVRGDNVNDYGVRGTDFKTVLGANRWVHYVFRYDGVGSNIDLFADGILVSNNLFRHRENAGVPTGPLVTPIPTQVIIGGFPNSETGFSLSPVQSFQKKFAGQIDEVRFYTASLSDADISALYQLEKAGR